MTENSAERTAECVLWIGCCCTACVRNSARGEKFEARVWVSCGSGVQVLSVLDLQQIDNKCSIEIQF